MILRLEIILSIVSYERKTICNLRNLQLTKNNTFKMFFGIEFSLIIASYQFLKNDLIFINYDIKSIIFHKFKIFFIINNVFPSIRHS